MLILHYTQRYSGALGKKSMLFLHAKFTKSLNFWPFFLSNSVTSVYSLSELAGRLLAVLDCLEVKWNRIEDLNLR